MRIRIAALTAAALSLAGCTLLYGPDDFPPPPTRADVETFLEAWLDAYLPRAASCYHAPIGYAERVELGSRSAYRDRWLELWDRGVLRFDAAQAEACLALVRVPGDCDAGLQTRLPPPSHACQQALKGSKGLGEGCAAGLECAPGLYCDGGAGTCPGTCASRSGAGGACGAPTGNYPSCQRDLICTGSGSTFCRSRYLPIGATCAGYVGLCGYGSYCSTSTGRCAALPPNAGDGCGDGAVCPMGRYCDAAVECVDKVPIGGDCGSGIQCVDGARCDASSKCESWVGLGETCGSIDAGDLQDCLASWCIGDICALPPVKGESSSSAPCAPMSLGVGTLSPGGVCQDICP